MTRQDEAAGGWRILEPGRNCWRIEPAGRAAVLVDAAPYYARLDEALRRARRSVMILGWDFDASIALLGHTGDGAGEQLGPLLRGLVENSPDLEIRVLVWNLSTLHAPGATLPLVLGDEWAEHERIRVRLDHDHPVYAAQHQKIVVIDDALAFVGGIDLTVERWDTPDHAAGDPRRVNADGSTYDPVHDVHMAVDGAAARAVGAYARGRWTFATGEGVPEAAGCEAPWPDSLEPDFTDVRVAIARTAPKWAGEPAVREIALLTQDALCAARRRIYIEAQYLTDVHAGGILEDLLGQPDGPEIVIVVTRFREAFAERVFMGENRDRLIRRLTRADRYGRLRTYCLAVPGIDGDCSVFVHSKLVIVDDDFLRVGSANLNNRSAGLDSECDLAIEATDDAHRTAIAAIRARLVGEHVAAAPQAVAEAEAASGSLVAAIDALNTGPRGLRPITAAADGPVRPVFGTVFVDPRQPIPLLSLWRWWRRGRALFRRRRTVAQASDGIPVR